MKPRRLSLLSALLPVLVVTGVAGAPQQVARHPAELRFEPLEFDPPDAASLRHELPGGAVAFVVEDHELPLVSISLQVRTGDYTAPALAKPGVAGLAGSQMRNGGTADLTPSELDEELDFLAAQMGSGIGSTSGSASLDCLTKDLDRCLELFFAIVRTPRFDEERLELARSQLLQGMERRNDSTGAIEGREWSRLVYGPDHFSTTLETAAQVEAITRQDLLDFHAFAMHPANFVFAVSGDLDTDHIVALLSKRLADWPAGPPPGEVPAPSTDPTPGLYLVDKPDANQGRISLGHRGVMRDHPDRYAIQLMNDILGGGGFTSRIMSRVRSDEGLAYSAGAGYSFGTYYDGQFRAFFQSRSEAVARAAAIVLQEIERIRSEPVTDEELASSKASFIETFTRNFASAVQVAGLYASLELTGRDPSYLETYRENVAAVTTDDVLRAAREYLHPDRLVILAVGNVADMLAGDPDHPEVRLEDLAPGGNVTRIPLPDPLTMQYPAR